VVMTRDPSLAECHYSASGCRLRHVLDARGAISLQKLPSAFQEPVRAWFEASFAGPTRAQALGWPPILAGQSTLLLAPTGSGKTLATFLTAIDGPIFTQPPDNNARCRVVYV